MGDIIQINCNSCNNNKDFFILYNNDLSSSEILSKHLDSNEINSLRLKAYPRQSLYKKLYNISRDLLKSYDQEESIKQSIYSITNSLPSSRFIAKEDASLIQKIGKTGESLVNKYLENKKNKKEIKDYFWLSNKNPSADHDFEVTDLNDKVKYIEVKSTKSSFETPFYWSSNEMNLFLNKPNDYLIKRISHVFDEDNVILNMGQNMHSLHKKLKIEGITFNRISSVTPNKVDIKWTNSISLKYFYNQLTIDH
jgi:hypothetical protein